MKRRIASRCLAFLLILAIGVPPAMAGDFIECSSGDGRYRYCNINTEGSARLVTQYSRTRCTEGRTWGYDRHGVWVDDGCRAQFEVAYRSRGGDSKDAAKVAGALVGLAILGAAVNQASKDRDRDRDNDRDRVPSWAIGTFEGYNPIYRADVTLKIYPSGEAIGYLDNRRIGDGTFFGSSLDFEGSRLRVEREGSGFRTIDPDDRDNIVHYRAIH